MTQKPTRVPFSHVGENWLRILRIAKRIRREEGLPMVEALPEAERRFPTTGTLPNPAEASEWMIV